MMEDAKMSLSTVFFLWMVLTTTLVTTQSQKPEPASGTTYRQSRVPVKVTPSDALTPTTSVSTMDNVLSTSEKAGISTNTAAPHNTRSSTDLPVSKGLNPSTKTATIQVIPRPSQSIPISLPLTSVQSNRIPTLSSPPHSITSQITRVGPTAITIPNISLTANVAQTRTSVSPRKMQTSSVRAVQVSLTHSRTMISSIELSSASTTIKLELTLAPSSTSKQSTSQVETSNTPNPSSTSIQTETSSSSTLGPRLPTSSPLSSQAKTSTPIPSSDSIQAETSTSIPTPTIVQAVTSTPHPTPSPDLVPYIMFANRGTIRKVTLGGEQNELFTVIGDTNMVQNAIAVDYDIRRNILVWTDVQTQQILMSDLNGNNIRVLVDRGLTIPDGIAWDWVNEKVYWTDPDHREIEVLDPVTGSRKMLIFTGDRTVPRGLVVDPVNTRCIYWTDWGDEAQIEKASMDGDTLSRTTLHNTDLVWPNDLTIDFTTQTLYWADANLDKIESSSLDGANRTLLTVSLVLHPFSITFYNGTLYWSDWVTVQILHTSLSSANSVTALTSRLPTEPMGLKVVHSSRQPLAMNPCVGASCSHLCLISSVQLSGYLCSCPEGMELNGDQVTCSNSTVTESPTTVAPLEGSCAAAGYSDCCTSGLCLGSPPTCFCTAFCAETGSCCGDISAVCKPDFMVFANRRFIQRLEFNTFNLRTLHANTSANAVGLDYDIRRGFLYWTDLASNTIFRSTLHGEDVTAVVNGTQPLPDGIAVDWISNKLYWTEASPKTISVIDLDRRHRLTLFSLSDASVPRGIALDPSEGYIFWTDWGDPAKVERALMDGTNRITLANTQLQWPNDITIDYRSKLLYWVDAGLDKIERSQYDGSGRVVITSNGVFHPFSITLFQGILYWTDWQVDAIFAKQRRSNISSVVYSGLGAEPMGIEAISASRQRPGVNPCSVANGNCEQLCLLSTNGSTTCACADGYRMSLNSSNCIELPTTMPPVTTGPPQIGSCRGAGFTSCCGGSTCEGRPPGCFCDMFCADFNDCCGDFEEICPRPSTSSTTATITSMSQSLVPSLSRILLPSQLITLSSSTVQSGPSLTSNGALLVTTPTPIVVGPKDIGSASVQVGAAIGGLVIVLLLLLLIALTVVFVVIRRRTSINYKTFENPADSNIEILSYQNPIAEEESTDKTAENEM